MIRSTDTRPQCVGFIMDGNRRWARKQGALALYGHTKGYETLLSMIEAVHRAGIPHMVCYAFSTENWKRSVQEVAYLMRLMHRALLELPDKVARSERKINLRVIGERERLEKDIRKRIGQVESLNAPEPDLTVWIALSYGGRAEIVRAVNAAIREGQTVTEENFKKFLWTDGMPDPDLIIRTSGEERLSNFLLWQSAYSELFFSKSLWPEFGEREFESILEEYGKRHRRKGA